MAEPAAHPPKTNGSSSPSLGDSAKVVDVENVEHAKTTSSHGPDSQHGQKPALQPPPWIAALSQEERHNLEKKLKRKIDLRLMPAIIIMYILNYIDRYVNFLSYRLITGSRKSFVTTCEKTVGEMARKKKRIVTYTYTTNQK